MTTWEIIRAQDRARIEAAKQRQGTDPEALPPPREGYEWVLTDNGGAYQRPIDTSPGPIAGGGGREATPEEMAARERKPDADEDNSRRDAMRAQAREEFRSILSGMGFTTDMGFTQAEINQLFSSVEGWINDGWADGYDGGDKLLMLFRTRDETKGIYQKRFPGMQALASRGQAISEGEYIRLEGTYREVLRSYGLPTQYYDSFDDYGRFIAGNVSAQEVEGRVIAARAAMNPLVAAELREYYGIGEDKALAFMLGLTDEKGLMLDAQAEARNQQTIRDIGRNIQIGGYAEGAGFGMTRTQSELLAGTAMGQLLDPFDQRTAAQLEGTFSRARRIANREGTLAAIDREAYTEMDTLEAAFGNDQKQLASERRAKRERARFSGSSGTAASSLSVERNF